MAVCVSKYPTLIDIEDIILTFERAIWRDQCEVVSEKVASERPKDAETIGSYVFLYKSTGLAGSWLSWPAWYGIETYVDTFCAKGTKPQELPHLITTRELMQKYSWITVIMEYEGIATHFMQKRTRQIFTSDPNDECNNVKPGYLAIPMLRSDAIARAKESMPR